MVGVVKEEEEVKVEEKKSGEKEEEGVDLHKIYKDDNKIKTKNPVINKLRDLKKGFRD